MTLEANLVRNELPRPRYHRHRSPHRPCRDRVSVAGRAGGYAVALEFRPPDAGRASAPAPRSRSKRFREIHAAEDRTPGEPAAAPRSRPPPHDRVTSLVPDTRSRLCICSISQGPWMTSAKPGQFLTLADGHLTTGLDTLNQVRFQHCACRVHGCRIAGRAPS